MAVLEEHPELDIAVYVVWVRVHPADGPEAVWSAAGRFTDPRVTQFDDSRRHAGRLFAEGLLPISYAWDTYLFYAPGAEWEHLPPRPFAWSHQLGRIATDHFHTRERLFDALRAAASALARR